VAAQTVVWIGTTAALLTFVGSTAVGIGMFAGGWAVAIAVGTAIRRQVPMRIAQRTAVPAALAAVSSAAGWLVADAAGRGVVALVLSLATGLALYGAGIYALRRDDARTLARLLGGALRRAPQG
jgi:hypothetical protein